MTILGIILSILIFIVIYVFFHKKVKTCIVQNIFYTFILDVFIICVFLWLGTFNIKYEKDNKFGIKFINSLSVNSSISGNFVLGTGTIENKNYYYYINNSEFGYQIKRIEIENNVYVKEDCNNKPYIEFTNYNCVYQNWFSKLIFTKKTYYIKDKEIIIHVPKNTVIKNYTVDTSKL